MFAGVFGSTSSVGSGTATLPSGGKRKAPAPPPPGVDVGHTRHPSDPTSPGGGRVPAARRGGGAGGGGGHVRSPSDPPPPLPFKPPNLRGANPPPGESRVNLSSFGV